MLSKKSPKTVGLVITTYNWKEALAVVLHSISKQSRIPDEVLIADDGSRDDTHAMIEQIKKIVDYNIIHIHHPDEGFQVSKIRNRAIAAAQSEYIISIDGDMLLHKNFIEDHLSAAQPNTFIQGGRVIMDESLTKTIIANPADINNVGAFSKGVKNRKNSFRVPLFMNFFASHSYNNLKRIRGCNQSFWKKDLITVNGFNEAFQGWGREDSDICLRLMNAGINRANLKFGGIAYHLYHPEATRSSLATNDDILQNAIDNKLSFCEKGLTQYSLN